VHCFSFAIFRSLAGLDFKKIAFLGDISMFRLKTVAAILTLALCTAGIAATQSLEDNWNDFLHYTKIGRLDLAKGYAQAVIESKPDPVELLSLSEKNRQGYLLLLRVIKSPHDTELAGLAGKILEIIEQGKFARRADPKIIVEEIKRLSTNERGRLAAVRRLKNAGEYAIPFMLDALADRQRKSEWEHITWAMPQVGRDAIRPLTAALQTDNVSVKAEIIKALGKIGYTPSLGYLKFIIENDGSAELQRQARDSIRQINPANMVIPAADLFFSLAENYYYHAQSLKSSKDDKFCNVWFWDTKTGRLVREKVDKDYFNELMAMRVCEWALKADPKYGRAIGLWIAAFFKAESANVEVPRYFGAGHADAMTYATTAGPEYLHHALARAIKDGNAYVALGAIEALAVTAGEKSLMYRLGAAQPLVHALSFNDRAVKYSAAIAIASAGPQKKFPETMLVVQNLALALGQMPVENDPAWNQQLADSYAFRAAGVMLKLAQTRNPVINLAGAQESLIAATKDKRAGIQILAGQILAHLDTSDAQRSVAAMALDENNSVDVRIAAFNSLTVSAKINANLLEAETIDAIYALTGSKQTESALQQLRASAASAYGAFNLPSERVKTLILDQAKS